MSGDPVRRTRGTAIGYLPGTEPKARFAWTAFPIFIGAAAKLPRVIYWPVLVISAAGLFFLIAWWPHHRIGSAS